MFSSGLSSIDLVGRKPVKDAVSASIQSANNIRVLNLDVTNSMTYKTVPINTHIVRLNSPIADKCFGLNGIAAYSSYVNIVVSSMTSSSTPHGPISSGSSTWQPHITDSNPMYAMDFNENIFPTRIDISCDAVVTVNAYFSSLNSNPLFLCGSAISTVQVTNPPFYIATITVNANTPRENNNFRELTLAFNNVSTVIKDIAIYATLL